MEEVFRGRQMVADTRHGEGIMDLMRCSTCGETLRAGEARCPTCGAAVASRVPVSQRHIRQCPRCSHRGDGISYFRKASHIGLLVGLSVFTYGVGGVVYYALRRRRRVCPNCGLGWEHSREPGEGFPTEGLAPVTTRSRSVASVPEAPLPPSGIGRRVFGGSLAVLATIMITAGISTSVFEPVVIGSAIGMAGSGLFLWGWKALQQRRESVLNALNRKVLMLATRRDGVLTVTDVAAELDLTIPAAEKILVAMDDGFRVRSEITDDGVLYYEFPEVRHRKKLASGDAD